MKGLVQYIEERYVNAATTEDVKKLVEKYGDDMMDIINYGYRDIGGCSGIEKKEDIHTKADFAKLYRKDGKIVGVALYADKRHPNKGTDIYVSDRTKNRGRKLVAVAASEENSAYLRKILTEDFPRMERNVLGEYLPEISSNICS